MKFETIIQNIRNSMTGDAEKDLAFLREQMGAYKGTSMPKRLSVNAAG